VWFRHAGLFIYSFNVNVRPLIAGRTFFYRTSCIVRSSNAHSGIDPRSALVVLSVSTITLGRINDGDTLHRDNTGHGVRCVGARQ
jgi:hypothetical protein